MSGECLVTLPNIFSFWGEIFSVENILQRVSREVPLDGVLEGVGTLEELLALLLSKRSLAGVHVLVEKLPELVGKVHHLQILGQSKDRKYSNLFPLLLKTYSKPDLRFLETSPK